MASCSSNTLKAMACAMLLLSTFVVSHGRCEPDESRASAAAAVDAGRKMLATGTSAAAAAVGAGPKMLATGTSAAAAAASSAGVDVVVTGRKMVHVVAGTNAAPAASSAAVTTTAAVRAPARLTRPAAAAAAAAAYSESKRSSPSGPDPQHH